MNWMPPPQWDTLAGRVLDAFFRAVHDAMPAYDSPLTLFGSAPIQLCLDEAFASADVDIMVLEGGDRLREIANAAVIGRSGVNPGYGVQICPPSLFKTTPHYLQRAWIGKTWSLIGSKTSEPGWNGTGMMRLEKGGLLRFMGCRSRRSHSHERRREPHFHLHRLR